MKIINGDIWYFRGQGYPIVITTNGSIKKNGECVMGRGVALDMKERYPTFPTTLGRAIKDHGNRLFYWPAYNVITYPVKYYWNDAEASWALIQYSAKQLVEVSDKFNLDRVYLVKPGCGCGKLRWEEVERIIGPILDDRFTIVNLEEF